MSLALWPGGLAKEVPQQDVGGGEVGVFITLSSPFRSPGLAAPAPLRAVASICPSSSRFWWQLPPLFPQDLEMLLLAPGTALSWSPYPGPKSLQIVPPWC